MLLMIDNYDSFTYNVVQYLAELGAQVEVRRNDQISVEEVEAMAPARIVISPGPCTPDEAGISMAVIERFAGRVPLLGVCLGHQSLVAAFGGEIGRAERILHGKTCQVRHDGRGLFRGLPNPIVAARYHSLIPVRIPDCFEICAHSVEWSEPMAVRHRERPLFGLQFHPESFLTPEGPQLLANFLEFPDE
jgi:anthranilate synthase/aminodeoxychorismate synthase-like glutamine amidotransferase